MTVDETVVVLVVMEVAVVDVACLKGLEVLLMDFH